MKALKHILKTEEETSQMDLSREIHPNESNIVPLANLVLIAVALTNFSHPFRGFADKILFPLVSRRCLLGFEFLRQYFF